MIQTTLFACFLMISTLALSQPADTAVIATDSVEAIAEEFVGDKPDSKALPDTAEISVRKTDNSTLHALRSDTDLKYKEPPTIAESLWDRFLAWLEQIFESIVDNTVDTDWGRVALYIGGAALLIGLVMTVMKVNAFDLFYSRTGASTFRHNTLDENIHAMNFEKLIEEAMTKNDYRLGVRLVFLYSLKMLSDKNLIHWDQGKTNHDYLSELKKEDLKEGFHDLNYYFEYTWYGNFRINSEMFSEVQSIFNNWKAKIR